MASYKTNSFTISLRDYADTEGKSPTDFSIETIVVKEPGYGRAIEAFDEIAKNYHAVLNVREGSTGVPGYFIRGTGVKLKRLEQKKS